MNAKELSEEAPSAKDLAEAVLEELGEHELDGNVFWMKFPESEEASKLDLALALIQVKAPEPITSYQMRNSAIRIAPVPDFQKLVDSIDYGRVLSQDPQTRVIRLRVDTNALDEKAIREMIRRSGRERLAMGLTRRHEPFQSPFPKAKSPRVATLSDPDPKNVGDWVTVEYNRVSLTGEVVAVNDHNFLEVRFSDLTPLNRVIKTARLKGALRRSGTLRLPAPFDRTKRADKTPIVGVKRTWKDMSGRFSIEATLEKFEDGVVTLLRTDGKRLEVPLTKLSEADQQFVSGGAIENPFSTPEDSPQQPASQENILSARLEGMKSIRQRGGAWQFTPKPVAAADHPDDAQSVDLPKIPNSEAFHESVGDIIVSRNGKRVGVTRKAGRVTDPEQWSLDVTSPATGALLASVLAPAEAELLDAHLGSGLVLLRSADWTKHPQQELFVRKVNDGKMAPVCSWKPYAESRKPGSDKYSNRLKRAWFINSKYVITVDDSDHCIRVWDWESATAVLQYWHDRKLNGFATPTPSLDRRLMAIPHKEGVDLVDLGDRRFVGTLEFPAPKEVAPHAVAIREDQSMLAAVGYGYVAAWDLRTGKLVCQISRPEISISGSATWAGDYLLVEGKYLYDVDRRILFWELNTGGTFRQGASQAAAGRLWYVPQASKEWSSYLGSIPLPHPRMQEVAKSLGTSEDMLIWRPGDEVELAIDIDNGVEGGEEVRDIVTQKLNDAGLKVVDRADTVVAVSCKKLPQQTVRVDMKDLLDSYTPKIVEKTIEPWESKIEIYNGGRTVWKVSGTFSPFGNIYLQEGETLDDALRRLTKPDLRFLHKTFFSSHLARPGNVTDNGAYGLTRLGSAGVFEDITERPDES